MHHLLKRILLKFTWIASCIGTCDLHTYMVNREIHFLKKQTLTKPEVKITKNTENYLDLNQSSLRTPKVKATSAEGY